MTLQEFDETSFSTSELYDMICENDYYEMIEDVYTADAISENMDENIREYLSNYGWESLKTALENIDLDGYLYVENGWLDYVCVDDDDYYADEWKQRLRELMIDDDRFDPEEDEENNDAIAQEAEILYFDSSTASDESGEEDLWYKEEVDLSGILTF